MLFCIAYIIASSVMFSDSASSGDEAAFGRLWSITPADLVALSSRIRKLVSKAQTSEGHLVETCSGSYNLVHIVQLDDTKMVIRIPVCGQAGDLPSLAGEALASQVYTINYIRVNTDIPVPDIFHFDTTANNEIGAPYIAMSYVSGTPVSRLWFDAGGPTPREERRRNILRQLARAMSQLQRLSFNEIGSLSHPKYQSSSGHGLGPCYDWDEAEDGTVRGVTCSGPFSSSTAFLDKFWVPANQKSDFAVGAAKVLEEMRPFLPSSTSYVLALPDYDSQNVMADEAGNITGLIDWDNVQTVPDFLGCLRYPGWITRDWDPLMYGWPNKSSSENSPDELQQYREYYLSQIKKALGTRQGRSSYYRLTEKSHVFEAFWIALANVGNRTGICQKFVDEAKCRLSQNGILPEGLDQAALNILYDIAHGQLENEDWGALRKGLQALMTPEN